MPAPSIEKPATAIQRQERIRPHLAKKLIMTMAGSSAGWGASPLIRLGRHCAWRWDTWSSAAHIFFSRAESRPARPGPLTSCATSNC